MHRVYIPRLWMVFAIVNLSWMYSGTRCLFMVLIVLTFDTRYTVIKVFSYAYLTRNEVIQSTYD